VPRAFSGLGSMSSNVSGEGPALIVRIAKNTDLPAVQIVREGQPGAENATAIREVDLWNRFPFQYKQIAQILALASYVQVRPLAIELGLRDDPAMYLETKRGSQTVYGYSQAALEKMRQAIAAGADIKEIYRKHNTASGKAILRKG
jgi:hypothetical protein